MQGTNRSLSPFLDFMIVICRLNQRSLIQAGGGSAVSSFLIAAAKAALWMDIIPLIPRETLRFVQTLSCFFPSNYSNVLMSADGAGVR